MRRKSTVRLIGCRDTWPQPLSLLDSMERRHSDFAYVPPAYGPVQRIAQLSTAARDLLRRCSPRARQAILPGPTVVGLWPSKGFLHSCGTLTLEVERGLESEVEAVETALCQF